MVWTMTSPASKPNLNHSESNTPLSTKRADLLLPVDVASLLPSRPIVTSPMSGWHDVMLQHFKHPPSTIDLPELRDTLLVSHLAGPVLVENYENGQWERRWTGPGQVSVTPAGQQVHRVLKGRPDVIVLHLAAELMQSVAREFGVADPLRLSIVSRFAEPDVRATALTKLLLAEAEEPGPATHLMADTVARALAIHLFRQHSSNAPAMLRSPAPLSNTRLVRVMDKMRSCLDEDLSLEQLAEIAGLSASHFMRAFRNAMGVPPHQYLLTLRFEQAQRLLEQSDLSVTEVGLRCGFNYPGHFATSFRKATGLSPRAWRQARQS